MIPQFMEQFRIHVLLFLQILLFLVFDKIFVIKNEARGGFKRFGERPILINSFLCIFIDCSFVRLYPSLLNHVDSFKVFLDADIIVVFLVINCIDLSLVLFFIKNAWEFYFCSLFVKIAGMIG